MSSAWITTRCKRGVRFCTIGKSVPAPKKTVLLDRLLAERRITPQQRQAALSHAESTGCRPEEALLELAIFGEDQLLKWLASHYRTRFVSTEKLAKAEIERGTLALVAKAVADEHLLLPVLFNAADKSLALVTADPDDVDVLHHVQIAAGVKSVTAYVARPASIRAGIQKHYGGDIHAFSRVDAESYQQLSQVLDAYQQPQAEQEPVRAGGGVLRRATLAQESPVVPRPATSGPRVPPLPDNDFSLISDTGAMAPPPPRGGPKRRVRAPAGPSASGAPGLESAVQLVGVLVGLLESQREELRGHSVQVAQLMQDVGRHMRMSAEEVASLGLTGLLHDLAKVPGYHLTALNVAQYDSYRAQAAKCFTNPVRLFEQTQLPKAVVESISSMYERYDGQGFPERRPGKDVPFGARLLAVAESYSDLVLNANNPFRRTLAPKAAIDVLLRYRGRVFDPDVVDVFRVTVLAAEEQTGAGPSAPRILLVDGSAEETRVLERRLLEQGFDVVVGRSAEQAYQLFQQGGVDVVITEVDLEPYDGLTLVEYIRKSRSGADIPVFFLTSRADGSSVDRGFSLGAADYIVKPALPEVVMVKVRNTVAQLAQKQGPRGVSGSLREMSLPDVLQVFSRTRKTGLLKINSGGYVGEIHFNGGAIYNASYKHQRAAEAVYAMLRLSDGEFALDTSFAPRNRMVHQSTEQLLLEGMRRVDEGGSEDEEEVDFSATRIDES